MADIIPGSSQVVAVVFIPEESRIQVFSTPERASKWANDQPATCIVIHPMVVDVPEFGNEASEAEN